MEPQTLNDNETLIGRMDVLINLMFKLLEKDGKASSARDKIIMLSSFGLTPKDIAKIINSTPNHVSVELSMYRSKEKKKQGQEVTTSTETTPEQGPSVEQ
jgi:hypothetical protein